MVRCDAVGSDHSQLGDLGVFIGYNALIVR